MLTEEALQFLRDNFAYGGIDPKVQAVVLPSDVCLVSMEDHSPHRYRERYNMQTNSVGAFVEYTNDRAAQFDEESLIASVDGEGGCCKAIFNAKTDGQPGHCDDTATCTLKELPLYQEILSFESHPNNRKQLTQNEVIDWLRDWHEAIDDAGQLIKKFQDLQVAAQSDTAVSKRDFGEARSDLEKIDVKFGAGEEIPSVITLSVEPYAEFSIRPVAVNIALKSVEPGSKPVFAMRVAGLELLKQEIAREFQGMLTAGLSKQPVIGTVRKA